MSHLLEQIAIEKQRIAVFEEKIAKCKKRIDALEFLAQDSDDELDTLASGTSLSKQNDNATDYVFKRPLNANAVLLLKFIGVDGKSIKDMVAYSNENDLGLSDNNIRNFAVKFRKTYGLLDSPHMGFYKLTDAGIKAIK